MWLKTKAIFYDLSSRQTLPCSNTLLFYFGIQKKEQDDMDNLDTAIENVKQKFADMNEALILILV